VGQTPTFTLDEDEELQDEQPLLAARTSGPRPGGSTPAAYGGSPTKSKARQLLHQASKAQIVAEDDDEGWPIYRHEAWR
jgi:hypothetical protein